MKLPANFLSLPRTDQRKIIVERDAERFENGDPNAWFDLLLYAVSGDPHIPEQTKVELRASLLKLYDGEAAIDPISPERRAKEKLDMDIYAAMMQTGGSQKDAKREAAKLFGLSESTILRKYEAHIKRWPMCKRLDGRNKSKKKSQTTYLRG